MRLCFMLYISLCVFKLRSIVRLTKTVLSMVASDKQRHFNIQIITDEITNKKKIPLAERHANDTIRLYSTYATHDIQ